MVDTLPEWLRAPGPRGLPWWQWLALPALLLVSWLLGVVLGRLTRVALASVARRTSASWDDDLVSALGAPLTLAWAVGAARALLPLLHLRTDVVGPVMRTAVFVAFFWFLLRLVTALGQIISRSQWALSRPATRSLVPLGGRILQVGVLAMGAIAILADLGFAVGSLIAGLGIGGLALALAGQKTVENLFGAFSIGVDQPFRVGDAITVEGVSGTVEMIGLRSTRIRTADRTVVTIPNGKLADMRVECMAPRDRLRLACLLGLSRATTAAQMRHALGGIESALRAQPKLLNDGLTVRFKEIAASSLDVEVQAYFGTTDWGEFQGIRQEILLAFLSAVEDAGTELAVPVREVRMRGGAAPRV